MADSISNTPRNRLLGMLSDGLQGASDFVGTNNPPVQMLTNALGVNSLARTLNEMSYGGALTTGSGQTTHLKDDTTNAMMALFPALAGAAKAAPAVGRGAAMMAENAMAPTSAANLQRGAINVYHGTPHSFDAFDMSKIGTGEGAQAYGHGLYFAENPAVAGQYAKDLVHVGLSPDGQQAAAVLQASVNPALRAKALSNLNPAAVAEAQAAISKGGTTYETRLAWPDAAQEAADPLGPQHFLNWDAPLSQQPQNVRTALASGFDADTQRLFSGSDPNGSKLYEALAGSDQFAGTGPFGVPATNYLRQAGIPGIRYMDQGSRGAGQGTSNYVVFNDQIPTITGRR